jgi:hypothetical protein
MESAMSVNGTNSHLSQITNTSLPKQLNPQNTTDEELKAVLAEKENLNDRLIATFGNQISTLMELFQTSQRIQAEFFQNILTRMDDLTKRISQIESIVDKKDQVLH